MALSDDQKAMLRLLAQREEGYDDIAALMGLSVDEVRAKVKDALGSLEDSAQATSTQPSKDEPAPPPPPKPKAPEPSPPATPKATQTAAASPPSQKASPASSKPAGTSPKPPSVQSRPRLQLPKDKGTRWALGAGVGVTVLLVVLLVSGVLGGGGGSDSTTTSTDNAPTEQSAQPTNGSTQPTQVELKAVDGGNGKGAALFARAGKEVLLVVHAEGLAPTAQDQSYLISLSRSATERAPIAATKVGDSGQISGQFKVSPESLGLLASGFDGMEVSLVSNDALKAALSEAKKTGSAPSYSGAAVLRGQVEGPIVNAATKSQP